MVENTDKKNDRVALPLEECVAVKTGDHITIHGQDAYGAGQCVVITAVDVEKLYRALHPEHC